MSAPLTDQEISALHLVAHIRQALGDDGRRMQDELQAHCRHLVAVHAAALILKQAKGRHHNQLAAAALFALLP
jgi:hypothetical protein